MSATFGSTGFQSALRGRRNERAALDGLLAGARAGRSGVLVLRGEAGIGKTALLDYAVAAASDAYRVVRATGVESERELPFAALQQLCAPMLDRLDRLPAPQRHALRSTFGLGTGPAPDRLLIGLAVLSLLSEVAEDRPLLCVVDDAQWLDHASALAVAFVARRLLAEPIVILVAARERPGAFAGLPEIAINGLHDAAARELLGSVIPERLDERVVDQLVAETHGNPLALLELPRGLSPAQLAGGFAVPAALSLPARIEERFGQRFEALPAATRQLVLVAAAESSGDQSLLWRAAGRLGIPSHALEPAESAGLLELGVKIRFRHPLVRSAVHRAATPQERRAAHRALAQATDRDADPDRRAWHRAEASVGPDEGVAAELEQAAGRAQARGGLSAAAAFLERAAALTLDPPRRARRMLAAARAKYEAGALDDAVALLAEAEGGTLDNLELVRADLLRAQIMYAVKRGSDAPALLLDAARRLQGAEPDLARATLLEALEAARFAGPLGSTVGVAEVSEAALARPLLERPLSPADLLLHGFATQYTKGYAAAVPVLKDALSAFRHEPALPPRDARWLTLACRAAGDVWDDEAWRLLSARSLARAREAGALTTLPLFLTTVAYMQVISGELDSAASLQDEVALITELIGTPPHRYIALWLAALTGREADLAELVHATEAEAEARGEGFSLAITTLAQAVLANALGRHEEALVAVRHTVEVDITSEMGSPRAVAELVEAAVGSGDRALAERAMARLVQTTRPSGTDWALGVEARSRALMAEGDAAETAYREAIERLGRTGVRLQLARSHLAYGEWLCRDRRRAAVAREHLQIAYDMLTAMGAEAFAGRARRELLAIGGHAPERRVATPPELTDQEAQIARLARDGLSNADIGARLFISRHTVAYHLRKVFAKLDITSRNKLGRALPDAADGGGQG
jgi:DNA-binding CsgD family transcriptional regulator